MSAGSNVLGKLERLINNPIKCEEIRWSNGEIIRSGRGAPTIDKMDLVSLGQTVLLIEHNAKFVFVVVVIPNSENNLKLLFFAR